MLPCGAAARLGVMTSRDVLIVLFEGVQSLDVSGPLEVFAGAGARAGEYRVATVAAGGGRSEERRVGKECW